VQQKDDAVKAVAEAIERIRAGAPAPAGGPRSKPAESKPAVEVQQVADEIERRRALFGRRQRNLSIADMVAGIRRTSERTNRRLGEIVALWEEMLPADLVEQTRMTSMRGGVLRVTVPSSTVGYELDRLLREGLLADLRSRFRGTLSRVVVRVGDITAEDR
jgi:DNA-binding transcriptional ArsR family regulator